MSFSVVVFAVWISLVKALPTTTKTTIERISNGENAIPKQFPYQVGLLLDNKGWCGGSLISDNWILTAAHCLKSVNNAKVYLGVTNVRETNETGRKVYQVEKANFIIHKDFNLSERVNDIALIKLPVQVEFNEYIEPVELPKKFETNKNFVGELAITSGWGSKNVEIIPVEDLQWIQVLVKSNFHCKLAFLGQIRPSHICISMKKGRKSPCKGDSGGPLVLDGNRKILIGVTSFGSRLSCEFGWPSVFTRTTSYLNWIEEHTGIEIK